MTFFTATAIWLGGFAQCICLGKSFWGSVFWPARLGKWLVDRMEEDE